MQVKKRPQVIPVDMSKKEVSDSIVVTPSAINSRDAGWQNLILEHHQQPAHEMPEVVFEQHILVVCLSEVASEYKIGDRYMSKTVRKGDMILIPAKADYWNVDHNEAEFIVLSVEPRQLLDCNQEIIKGDSLELIPTFPQPDPLIYGMALALQQELIDNPDGSYLYAESMLISLNAHLLHKYASKTPLIKNYREGLPRYKLKQAIDYINDNLDEKINIYDIAKLVDISNYYFCRMFHASMGISPYQYVLKQRIAKTKDLLHNSKLPLADIAFECGFSSQSQMTQHFRKQVGVTPKVYRNRL